jgi:predicted metal-dependent HD superfamily phosphohydrolase
MAETKDLAMQWQALCEKIGIGQSADSLFNALASAYSQPSRHYHNLNHIADCLAEFEPVRGLATNADAVELAIWYHDIVYDTHDTSNEARSAEQAQAALLAAGADYQLASLVRNLVLATRHTEEPQSADEALLMDIDLSILGKPAEEFDRYEAAIRSEYGWVPESLFLPKRSEILRGFLRRSSIYCTPWFRKRMEPSARGNIARSLEAPKVFAP